MHYHALRAQQKKIFLTSKYTGIKNCKQKTQMGEKLSKSIILTGAKTTCSSWLPMHIFSPPVTEV